MYPVRISPSHRVILFRVSTTIATKTNKIEKRCMIDVENFSFKIGPLSLLKLPELGLCNLLRPQKQKNDP